MPARKRIQQLPHADRPREKLQRKGAAALSDFELLEVLLGSGAGKTPVGSVARQVQRLLGKGPETLSYEALLSLRGVHTATAGKILAALELARRHLVRNIEPLRTQHDMLVRLQDLRTKQQEYLVALSLDGGQRLIAQRTVTVGTLDMVLAHPREVFADAIADRAACVVVAHNHPSGSAQPSAKDTAFTQQLKAAGQLLGVELYDHLILAKTEHFSFRQHHLL
ncbi:MAG TPA: DNA repair protein RadC [Candidatus Saccharimonadales bacterium]|nr:DNA repair protein RadC [Candidatus Saccharimonadales bacterium]